MTEHPPTNLKPHPEEAEAVRTERERLFLWLRGNLRRRNEAVTLLLRQKDLLQGPPPPELLQALIRDGCKPDDPLMKLSLRWEREPLCRALFDRFASLRQPRRREPVAAFFVHLPHVCHWQDFRDIALDRYETAQIRRLMTLALAALARDQMLSWQQVAPLCEVLLAHSTPHLREGCAALLLAFPEETEAHAGLNALLADPNPWLLASVLRSTLSLPPERQAPFQEALRRLQDHPHPLIQQTLSTL